MAHQLDKHCNCSILYKYSLSMKSIQVYIDLRDVYRQRTSPRSIYNLYWLHRKAVFFIYKKTTSCVNLYYKYISQQKFVTLIWACHKVYLNLTQFNVINLLVTGWQVFSMFPIFPPKLKYVMISMILSITTH
jgi:hypothetical protein